ncbi:MAG: flagellar basal body rod C-terminal domain-containing protein, partial [Hyphomonadaceae bacterium]
LAEALGGFAAEIGDALNAVHNENTSYPALGDLTGRQTGLLATDALNFSGRATIGVTNAAGELTQRLTINFDTGQITAEQPPGAFAFGNTIASFTNALNLALGAATPAGAASFTDGQLSLSVGSGGGLVVQQDGAAPSARAGRGFAHFFGLNDLVSRPTPLFFESGGSASDVHGLNAGGVIDFVVRDTQGRVAATPSLAIAGALAAGGSTWTDMVAALNNTSTGLGQYATFSYDAAEGRVTWTPKQGFEVALVGDTTERGATGVSMSSLFGLGTSVGATRAVEAGVNAQVSADPSRLAVGRPDLTAALGEQIMEAGDNRGAAALSQARDTSRAFKTAGTMLGQTTSLGVYAARFAGMTGRMASDAERAADGSTALATAAADRRAQVEGVSIDDELIRMTTYQNAYAAASRLIQAANEMYDILLQLGRY